MKKQGRCKEQTDGSRWEGAQGGELRKPKRLRNTNWQLDNSYVDIKYSTGNIINNIIITLSDGSKTYGGITL